MGNQNHKIGYCFYVMGLCYFPSLLTNFGKWDPIRIGMTVPIHPMFPWLGNRCPLAHDGLPHSVYSHATAIASHAYSWMSWMKPTSRPHLSLMDYSSLFWYSNAIGAAWATPLAFRAKALTTLKRVRGRVRWHYRIMSCTCPCPCFFWNSSNGKSRQDWFGLDLIHLRDTYDI